MNIEEDLNKKRIIITLSKREAEDILTDIDAQIHSFHYKITGKFISKLKFSWNVLNQFVINLNKLKDKKE